MAAQEQGTVPNVVELPAGTVQKWNHVPTESRERIAAVIDAAPKEASHGETYVRHLRKSFANGGDGRIWYYESGCWRVDSDIATETKLSQLIRSVGGEPTSKLVDTVLFQLARLENQVPAARTGINARNGFLEHVEGAWRLSPHHPGQGQRYILPFDYDPNAKCEDWLRFLREVQPKSEAAEHLRHFFGWVLLGAARPHEERFAIWHGDGANGKSVALGVLKALVGPENASSLSLHEFNGRNVEMLSDKLVNLGSETERSERVETAMLKKLVSGEPVTATPKYRHHYEFTCPAALVFAVNDVPPIDDRSGGIWRRLLLVPWNVTIPEAHRDKGLLKRLMRNELPGILNWTLSGASDVLKSGLFVPDCVTATSAQLRLDNNSVAMFAQENVEQSPTAVVSKADLYRAFHSWCGARGYKAMSEVNFGKELRRVLRDLKDGKTRAGYVDFEGCPLTGRANAYAGIFIPAERIAREVLADGKRVRCNASVGMDSGELSLAA